MNFDQTVKQILEGFNVYPQAQFAANVGPDQGMTSIDPNNGFPSKVGKLQFSFNRKKIKSKKKKA
jgi:hypothetical protein